MTGEAEGGWRGLSAAEVGESHLVMIPPLPCQDACVATAAGRPLLIVADGLGSKPLSHIGADAVVRLVPCYLAGDSEALFLFILFMTKTDLVDAIAKSAGITKKAAGAALEALLDAITKDLKKGNNVVLTGFGTFRVTKRAARTGVNPRNSSEKIKIPAMKVVAFKAGKGLKEAVR